MNEKKILNKLNKIAAKESINWIEEAEIRIARRDWIEKSSRIAMRILNELKNQDFSNKMSQRTLAKKMGVSDQYISKILKGQENLSLETISKIEKVLGISLIEVPNFIEVQELNSSFDYEFFSIPRFQAKKIFTKKPESITYDNYNPLEISDKRA